METELVDTPRVKQVRIIIRIILTLLLIFAAIKYVFRPSGGIGYRIIHPIGFPGHFVFKKDLWLVKYDSWGLKLFGYDNVGDDLLDHKTFPFYGITLSPNGRYTAAFSTEKAQINTLVIKKALYDSDRQEGPWGPDIEDRKLSLIKYHIPRCDKSNLEWSPHSEKIAYATTDELYIIDTNTLWVTHAKLPADLLLNELAAEWGKYNKNAALSPDNNRQDPLTGYVKELNDSAPLRLQKALHLEKNYRLLPAASRWNHFYMDSYVPSGRFGFAGRSIRWVNINTIYCDNWELKISLKEYGNLKITASKIALPSEFYARPIWSPKGDKAAYILYTKEMYKSHRPLVVIVDKKGKVLRKDYMSIYCFDTMRWSKDGNYIAYWNNLPPQNNMFYIYDTRNGRKWNVKPPSGVIGYADGMSGWDWEL